MAHLRICVFFIRFGQLLAQCRSDWQMKYSPNGGFNFFFPSLRNPRVLLKASCLLLSKVFLEKQNHGQETRDYSVSFPFFKLAAAITAN